MKDRHTEAHMEQKPYNDDFPRDYGLDVGEL
jgi:hypothetical protein